MANTGGTDSDQADAATPADTTGNGDGDEDEDGDIEMLDVENVSFEVPSLFDMLFRS